jgi:hypothetical protein
MKHIDNLKSQLLRHAVYFLENMEEFSPFGLTLFEGDRIVLDGVIEEDLVNDSSSETIIKRITDKLIKNVEEENALCIGIALNTVFSKKQENIEINAIEMRFLDIGANDENTYFIYEIIDSKVIILGETDNPWENLSHPQN